MSALELLQYPLETSPGAIHCRIGRAEKLVGGNFVMAQHSFNHGTRRAGVEIASFSQDRKVGVESCGPFWDRRTALLRIA